MIDEIFDEPCPNCHARLASPELTKCPQCGFALPPSFGASAVGRAGGDADERGPDRGDDRERLIEFLDDDDHDVPPLRGAGAAGTGAGSTTGHDPNGDANAEASGSATPIGAPEGAPQDLPGAAKSTRPESTAAIAAPAASKSASQAAAKQSTTAATSTVTKPGAKVVATTGTGVAGGTRLAWILGAIAVVLLIAGHMAGLAGFFPRANGLFLDSSGEYTAEQVRFGDRVVDLTRLLVQRAVLWVAAIVGLWAFSVWWRARVQSWSIACARLGAIAAITAIVGVIELGDRRIEIPIEVLLQAALFVGLLVLWFRVMFVDALRVLGLTAIGFMLVHLVAVLVVWATGVSMF